MARGRPLTELTLGGEDRDTLTRWVRRPVPCFPGALNRPDFGGDSKSRRNKES